MIHFIANPKAKSTTAVLAEIEERLTRENVPYTVHIGANKEETQSVTAELTAGPSPVTVIAVGGDGTLNDVLSGITNFETTVLGLVPAGTGNDFAAAAGIPEGAAALDLILANEPKPTDFIDCKRQRSINIAGLGIDVDIIERCTGRKENGKKMSYFRSLILSLLTYRGQKIEVTADGASFETSAYIAAVCNGKRLGGGIPLCPVADMGDGKLDLVVVDSPRLYRLPLLLIKLMSGKILTERITRHILCDTASIRQLSGRNVQIDGELVVTPRLETEIVRGKLMMLRG